MSEVWWEVWIIVLFLECDEFCDDCNFEGGGLCDVGQCDEDLSSNNYVRNYASRLCQGGDIYASRTKVYVTFTMYYGTMVHFPMGCLSGSNPWSEKSHLSIDRKKIKKLSNDNSLSLSWDPVHSTCI